MLLESALAVGLAVGGAGTIAALRTRAAARADRLALRLAHAREKAFVEAARRLADAARISVGAVRDEVTRAARTIAPEIDGVLFYEERDGALACVYAAGTRVEYFAGTHVSLDDANALPVRARAAGHRVTLADPGARPLHPTDVAALAVPLALDAGRICILVVAARAALDAETYDRLVTLADQASPAYLIALDREDDRRRAEYDGLTGLLTPRAFRQRLGLLIERARPFPSARLALLFVDTDRFKQWNDTYGHASGDALLRELACLLRDAARHENDLVARNGGDEFCLVFTDTDKASAIERAETLRRRIAAAGFAELCTAGMPSEVRISASVGVAAFPLDATTASDLLERADAAMYHSKQTGRDGVSYTGADGCWRGWLPLWSKWSARRPRARARVEVPVRARVIEVGVQELEGVRVTVERLGLHERLADVPDLAQDRAHPRAVGIRVGDRLGDLVEQDAVLRVGQVVAARGRVGAAAQVATAHVGIRLDGVEHVADVAERDARVIAAKGERRVVVGRVTDGLFVEARVDVRRQDVIDVAVARAELRGGGVHRQQQIALATTGLGPEPVVPGT